MACKLKLNLTRARTLDRALEDAIAGEGRELAYGRERFDRVGNPKRPYPAKWLKRMERKIRVLSTIRAELVKERHREEFLALERASNRRKKSNSRTSL